MKKIPFILQYLITSTILLSFFSYSGYAGEMSLMDSTANHIELSTSFKSHSNCLVFGTVENGIFFMGHPLLGNILWWLRPWFRRRL